MLAAAIATGLLAGLLAGGHLDNLARVTRLRWVGLLFSALIVRLGTEAALRWGVAVARRASLTPADVLNTCSVQEFRAALRRHKGHG